MNSRQTLTLDITLLVALLLSVTFCNGLSRIANVVHIKYLGSEALFFWARLFYTYGVTFYLLPAFWLILIVLRARTEKIIWEARCVVFLIVFSLPLLTILSALGPLGKLVE